MQRKPGQKVINKIMDRAIEINRGCPKQCRDFSIMTSPMRKGTLLLQWTTINVEISRQQCF